MSSFRPQVAIVLTDVFQALREIMAPYGELLDLKADEPGNLYLYTRHMMKNKKPLFFGAVQTKKNYVSYHLMPIYVNPSLLDRISPALRKCMQGKSCFNFKSIDEALFSELAQLTEQGYDDYRAKGFLADQ